MFHHVVLMKFGSQAGPKFHAAVEAYSERVRNGFPRPERYVYRRNSASRADGLSFAIIAAFASAADHEQYQVSEVHLEMKDYMTSFIERIVVCDVDEDLP